MAAEIVQSNPSRLVKIISIIGIGILFFLTAKINYLLFHSLAEGLFIIVSALVYVLATKTYRYSKSNYLYIIGVAYFFLAIIHFLHLLTYKGMNVFPQFTANTPTQLWLVSRFMIALTLVAAPLFATKTIRPYLVYGVYGLTTVILLIMIMGLGVFPTCFIPSQGLTSFKIAGEYATIIFLALSIIMLYKRREVINPALQRFMVFATGIMITESLSYTLYNDVYGIMNFVGHILGIVATTIIYRGIVLQGLEGPYDLIFRQLIGRNEELKKLSQFKSDFLANMSHEMRTPLTTVVALTDDLLSRKEGQLTEQQEDSLRDIKEGGKDLLNIINDLLDMSRIETDKLFLVLTEVDVGSIACEVERSLRSLTLQKRLDIRVKVENPQKIVADKDKVKRVIQNLLVNAIKFTPSEGHVELTVEESKESEGIILRVKDTGIGIALEHQERIFESFYQVDRGKNREFPGTGLGLTLVKKILELHKGWIKLYSEEGKGTTFEVFWPHYPLLDEDLS